jgi:hypothetical protein
VNFFFNYAVFREILMVKKVNADALREAQDKRIESQHPLYGTFTVFISGKSVPPGKRARD